MVIPVELKERLDQVKVHRRETYGDVIERLLNKFDQVKDYTQE